MAAALNRVSRIYIWIIAVLGVLGGLLSIGLGAMVNNSFYALENQFKSLEDSKKDLLKQIVSSTMAFLIALGVVGLVSSIGAIIGLRKRVAWLLIQFPVAGLISGIASIVFGVVYLQKLVGTLVGTDAPASYNDWIYTACGGALWILSAVATVITVKDFKRQNAAKSPTGPNKL